MEKQNPSIFKSAMTYGLYMGLILIVYALVLYFAGLTGNTAAGYFTYLVYIGMLCYTMINFRDKENGGALAYGQGVGLGTFTMVVGGVLSSIFSFILMKYIDPGLMDQLVNKALEDAMAKGTPEEQLEMVEKMVRMFTNPTAVLLLGIFGSGFIGAIISLILAAIFKKEPSIFDSTEVVEEA